MKRIKTLFLSVLLISIGSHSIGLAQSASEGTSPSRKEIRKQTPKYLCFSAGLNSSKFRDFATSPLFYSGSAMQISLAYLKSRAERESEFRLSYDFGSYTSSFNDITATSKLKRVELNFSQLYRIEALSFKGFDTKVGFLLSGNGNLRLNPSFQNNAAGIDFFANILASAKISKDISRVDSKEKKMLFLKFTKTPRKRSIAFRLNAGLMNSSFRNGYVYSRQFAVLNSTKAFDEYEFNAFSGFRASTSLDYTYYLKNNNAFQFSYVWDAYATGGSLDVLEMAHNIFKLTFLFNTNNQ